MKRVIAIVLLLAGISLAIPALTNFGNYRSRSATAFNASDVKFANEAYSAAVPFALGSGALIILSIVLLVLSRKKKGV
jgi:hypothetical protein